MKEYKKTMVTGMERKLAKSFKDLVVWKKSHQLVLSNELLAHLDEVSKFLDAYFK